MIEVKLCKGYVGITADGRKATVFCQCIGCEPGSAFNVMLPGDSREEARSYYANGTPVNPGSPRIVAPYPSERPFGDSPTCYDSGEKFYVLNTMTGDIRTGKLKDKAGDGQRLLYGEGIDERWWFKENGEGKACVSQSCEYFPIPHLRVLGPVEEKVVEPAKKEKRGMTRKRWEEIKKRAECYRPADAEERSSHYMLQDVVEWIKDHPIGMPFDPDEPEYEPHDWKSFFDEYSERNEKSYSLSEIVLDDDRSSGYSAPWVGRTEVKLDRLVDLSPRSVTYDYLMNHAVWKADGTPVARKKEEK